MNELPKALSAAERDTLVINAPATGARALEWIDAATELLAEQAAQIVVDGQRIAELGRERDGARVVAEQADLYRDASEQKLAAANALLARIVKYATEDRASTPGTTRLARALSEAEAHLSGQPTAPGPTEAEQAVLDACGALDAHWLQGGYSGTTWRSVVDAELARRGLRGH